MNADQLSQFAHSLDVSLQLSHQLESILLEETRAIEMHDPDDLLRVVTDKKALVIQLESETIRQKNWVEHAQHAFTLAGMVTFFKTFDQDHDLLDRWSNLRDSIIRCDRLNQANALLIERDRNRINLSLRILSGDDGVSSTYNLRGCTESGRQKSRSISQA